MKRNLILKILILLICIIIIAIITILFSLKKNEINEEKSSTVNIIDKELTDKESIENEFDISDVWYQLDGINHYKTTVSLETYIQKYFEKSKSIKNFTGFNINDVWCYTIFQNEQQIEEFYIDGYVYNSNFSDIKEIAIKFSLNENNSFKIETSDLENMSWNDVLNNKVQEIRNNWSDIKKQFEVEEPLDEEEIENDNVIDNEEDENENDVNEANDDDETTAEEEEYDYSYEEPKPAYNENEFVVLDVTDKDLINRYFTNFKIKTLINKQEAYNLLHKDTKNTLFKSYQEFENNIQNYLNSNTNINKLKIVRSIIDENGYTNKLIQYIVADKGDNMFGIEITGINDYTVAVTKK